MTPRIIGLDPGPERSGYVVFDGRRVIVAGIGNNINLMDWLTGGDIPDDTVLAIEMIASYGMPVGKEVFETCVWIGRFAQAFESRSRGATVLYVPRQQVKLRLCNSPRAKDANVRQALIDRFGPAGTKRAPGPLYGVKGHAWAALGVAATAYDLMQEKRNAD